MNNMATCNYIVGTVGAVIASLIMQASAAFPIKFTENGPGPGFWPFSLGSCLLLVAITLLIYTFVNRTKLTEEYVVLTTEANKRVYSMMSVIVAYCVLINLLGFYPASAIMIAIVMRLMDCHSNKLIAVTVFSTLLFIYLVFSIVLNTTLPQSIFWE